MLTDRRTYRLATVLSSLSVLILITVIAKNSIGLNSITVALLYLLVVLVTSAFADVSCGIVIAVVSGLLVNYYFLPPFGTLYIESPEDWVSFASYTVTALVVSHFAATVRRRAIEADRLQTQLSQLSKFTMALTAIRKEELTNEMIVNNLRLSYDLTYCAIYLFANGGATNPISSGVSPSRSSYDGNVLPSSLPNKLLDVITEEGPDVQCLSLKDRGETFGALVISQISLSHDVAEEIAAIVSLVIRY